MKCERCHQPAERAETERERWLCGRCGVWLHPDGAEIGPAITPEQATAAYEKFVISTAAAIVTETDRQKEKKLEALVECGVLTHKQADRLRYPALYEAADKAAEYLATPQSGEDP